MGRPSKFRHPLEELTKPFLARQLAGFVIELEALHAERKALDEKLAAVFDEIDDEGFDKAMVRKEVARRAKPADKREAEEIAADAYSRAIELGFSSHVREGNADAPSAEKGASASVGGAEYSVSEASRPNAPGPLGAASVAREAA